MGVIVKDWFSEKDLTKLGLTQRGLERLAEIGALPEIVHRGGKPGILVKDFASLFEHLGASFYALRMAVLEEQARKDAYGEVLDSVQVAD